MRYIEKFNKLNILSEEIEISGFFIYDGLNYLKEIDVNNPSHHIKLFMANYNISVGMERMLKVLYIYTKKEKLPTNHKSYELYKKINVLNLNKEEENILKKLQNFYKDIRYNRLTYFNDEIIDNTKELNLHDYNDFENIILNMFNKIYIIIDELLLKDNGIYFNTDFKISKLVKF